MIATFVVFHDRILLFFTGVCAFGGRGFCLEVGVCMGDVCIEGADPPKYSQPVVGTHPTGKHPCHGNSFTMLY